MEANGECGNKAVKKSQSDSATLKVRKRREYANIYTWNLSSIKSFTLKKRSADASPLIAYKPTRSPLIVMGEPISHPGEIPWQVLLHSNVRTLKSPFASQPLGDFCGGILRYMLYVSFIKLY